MTAWTRSNYAQGCIGNSATPVSPFSVGPGAILCEVAPGQLLYRYEILRYWDCNRYSTCLEKAAHANKDFKCDGCSRYAKIERSELVTPIDLFGCWLLALVVSYPNCTRKQAREVLYRICDDLMTHTEFPKVRAKLKWRPISEWQTTPITSPESALQWSKRKRN